MSVSGKPLHIDIPVKLNDVKTVYSIGALTFEGDLPASIFHLQLITNDIADSDAKSEVVAVFHTNAGHVTLHDAAYNADRNIDTGNPYKNLVADLIKRGVGVELSARPPKLTTGATPTFSPISKSTRMPWRGRHNLFSRDSSKSQNEPRKIRGSKNEFRHLGVCRAKKKSVIRPRTPCEANPHVLWGEMSANGRYRLYVSCPVPSADGSRRTR